MLKLDKHEVKRIIKVNDMSPKLQQVIRAILNIQTSHCYDYARPDLDKLKGSTEIGLNIYRDYYRYIEVVYPKKEWVDTDKNYYSSSVCKITQNEDNEWTADLYEFSNLPQLKDRKARKELELELTSLFNGDLSYTTDYQYEMVQEAIQDGNFEDLEDLIGDRDLFEFI